jgi:predicted amidohydrolase
MKLVLVQPKLAYDPAADNLAIVHSILAPHAASLEPLDVVLLPEHVVLGADKDAYEHGIGQLARALGCHVVGGSHHQQRTGDERINTGVASDPDGRIIGQYEKLRPYADERRRVHGGDALGELSIGDCRILVLICADFWFSDVFHRTHVLPDLVLVPAHSVSRKPEPNYSRALWRHLAVARAYEFGVYVGISDWAYAVTPGFRPPSGVGGFADPTQVDAERFFTPIAGDVSITTLDFAALDNFRNDRRSRGFFWKAPPSAGDQR